MIIYLLYDAKWDKSEAIDDNAISEIAENCFSKKTEELVKKPCNMSFLAKQRVDFYCVIDEKIDSNPLDKKKVFQVKLNNYLNRAFGSEVTTFVKLETNFNPDSILTNSKKAVPNAENYSDSRIELDYEKRAKMFEPKEPKYTFDRVILPESVLEKIEESLAILECENKVFKEWGLYTIQPNPSSALSFYGPSGTGKTMAAEAIASKLHKKILRVSYADIESKYHGEGPKMVKAIFLAAEKEDAVLFIDESDSLLSKRLTNVTQGSEQAINSMRSQLLICLEEFKGIVIFATNLVVNYDQAFLTRLISIEFVKPDADCREKIWNVHIKGDDIHIPLADDVDTKALAEQFAFCGREIRKSVISACVSAAMHGRDILTQDDFVRASQKIQAEEERLAKAEDHTAASKKTNLTPNQENFLKDAMKSKIDEQKSDNA
ncbi:MAG: AAA family ATPase [Ruminococcus sp.]|nr:AAA family ATPase [Ruminococcus sp.]